MEKEYAYGVYPTMLTPYRANGSIDICTAENMLNGISVKDAREYLHSAVPL